MNTHEWIKNDNATYVKYDSLEISTQLLGLYPADLKNDFYYVITAETNFHPIDFKWKDQPSDRGLIYFGEMQKEVLSCVVIAVKKESGELLIDKEITAKRDDSNWLFFAGHLVQMKDISLAPTLGQEIFLSVDKDYRYSLSSAHTLAHLTALALNKATHAFWLKDIVDYDSLEHKDFDRSAIQESVIFPYQSKDTYRLGKSLKRKGFEINRFFNELSSLEKKINETVRYWVKSEEFSIEVLPKKSRLSEKREWRCKLPDGNAVIPCGGTHLSKWPCSLSFTICLEIVNETEINIISSIKEI